MLFDWTPLHYAIDQGHINVVNFLIKNGANINAKTKSNSNPLHFASQNGNLEIVTLLVEKGTVINEQDTSIKPT